MSDTLKPIHWIDQDLVANFQQRVVEISGIRCKVFTVGDYHPGAFGVKMAVKKTGRILVQNRLPYDAKTCVCDAAMPEMPAAYTNPCWLNIHFHGSWVNHLEDDVYACIKPEQQKQYCYTLNRDHPTGLFIVHSHNFNSSVIQEHITTFPVWIVDPEEPDYPKSIYQESLFIHVAYMQKCDPPPLGGINGCELETFDFTHRPISELSTSPKLVLTNGLISPVKEVPLLEPIILRIAYTGVNDTMHLQLLDEFDRKIPFRVLSIDSQPIATQCVDCKCKKCRKQDKSDAKRLTNIMIVDDFFAAHMQRLDIMFVLEQPTQYRLVKYVTPEEAKSAFSTGSRVLLFLNPKHKDKCELLDCKAGESGPVLLIPKPPKPSLRRLELKNSKWVQLVNRKFRHFKNIAAWRTIRFNFPAFPDMEGAMFDPSIDQITMVANHPEVWLVGSQSGTHSFHIHLMWFLVMASRPSADASWNVIPREKQYFQDTIVLTSGQQVLLWLFPFADKRVAPELRATGKIMAHCHVGDHVDSMMMLSLLIDPNESAKPAGIGLLPGPQSPEVSEIVKSSACDFVDK